MVGYDWTPSLLGGGRSCGRKQVVPTTVQEKPRLDGESYVRAPFGGRLEEPARATGRFGKVTPPH